MPVPKAFKAPTYVGLISYSFPWHTHTICSPASEPISGLQPDGFSSIPLSFSSPPSPAVMFSVRKAPSLLLSRCRTPSVLQLLSPLHSSATMRLASTLPRLPIFEAIANHDRQSTAVVHSASGRRFTYGELLGDVAEAKDRLLQEAGGSSIDGHRIAFLVENSYDYVGGWTARNTAEGIGADKNYSNSPLYTRHPLDCSPALPRLPRTRVTVYYGPEPSVNAPVVEEV